MNIRNLIAYKIANNKTFPLHNILVFTLLFIIIMGVDHAKGQGIFPNRYHTYQEVLDTLADLRDSHTQILALDTLGYSNRDSVPILRVKISDNPRLDEDEPAVFFCGGVHADEILGVEVALNFVQELISRYDHNDWAALYYIRNLEIFVVPFINPEGHVAVERGNLNWRKNRSDNDADGVFDYHDGVDNNRNYDFGWNIDVEAEAVTSESRTFKGCFPFSETENLAMRDFGWRYRPVIAIDYHSPAYGRPNVAYYPWYWDSADGGHGIGPDESLTQSICRDFCELILAIPNTTGHPGGRYEARRALVNKGDFKTYFYGNFGTAAFSVEISDTTIQDTALVDSIVMAHLSGQFFLLERALGPAVTGIIRDSITREPLEAEVQVLEHMNADINPRLSRPDFGRYHRLLSPGTYRLRFIKNNYQTKILDNVMVDSVGPTFADVLLCPLYAKAVARLPIRGFVSPSPYVHFDWPDMDGAGSYSIEISRRPGFDSPVMADSAVEISEYINSDSLTNGIYYWRVKAHVSDNWDGCCEAWNFGVNVDTLVVPYLPGDVNGDGRVIGSDVTYLINYFRGQGPPPPVALKGFYPAADANGDCQNRASDVTYLIIYLRGGRAPIDGHCF